MSIYTEEAERRSQEVCEVCGKAGRLCRFEKACSCWYGVPCVNGESIRKHRKDGKGTATVISVTPGKETK